MIIRYICLKIPPAHSTYQKDARSSLWNWQTVFVSQNNAHIQSVPRGKVNIVGGYVIGHCEKKSSLEDVSILSGYKDRTAWVSLIPKTRLLRFLFLELDEKWSLQKKGGYMRRIARSHFGCCCLGKGAWRSTNTNNTRPSHKSCKVHRG